jgi:hypothetical protein
MKLQEIKPFIMVNKEKQFMTNEGIAFLKNLMDVPDHLEESTAGQDPSRADHTFDYIKSLYDQIELKKQL